MARSFIARHAQSMYNVGLTREFNSELTPKGIAQATNLAELVRKEVGDRSICGVVSPYTRCLQTAHCIAQVTGITFKVDRRIGESPEDIHKNGSTAIRKRADLYPKFDWSLFSGDATDYNGETDLVFEGRIREFLDSMANKDFIAVSHMTPSVLMVRLLGYSGRRDAIKITNASLSLIENGKPVYVARET